MKHIIAEIRASIFQSWFHTLRYLGLLIIPFIYGFFYIFAFFDPFSKTEDLPVAIITTKYEDGSVDVLSEAIANEMSKSHNVTIGDLNMSLKLEHIYVDGGNIDDTPEHKLVVEKVMEKANDYNGTFYIPDYYQLLKNDIKNISDSNSTFASRTLIFADIVKKMSGDTDKVQFVPNFKKNYITAFGIDMSADLMGGPTLVINALLNTFLNDDKLRTQLETDGIDVTNLSNFISNINDSEILQHETLHLESHMGDDLAKYGFGLAPFFISVAIWVGAMVMTISIHGKKHDKAKSNTKTYLHKSIIMWISMIPQVFVLITSLWFIGFAELGISRYFLFLLFGILIAITFSTIITTIRFLSPTKTIGLLLVIMLLVLQMASSGGLFPIETQSWLYRALNTIMPLSRSVNIFRELSFETNWGTVFLELFRLSVFWITLPIGLYFYNKKYTDSNNSEINSPELEVKNV